MYLEKDIIKEIEQGKTIKNISNEIGVDILTILAILKNNSIKISDSEIDDILLDIKKDINRLLLENNLSDINRLLYKIDLIKFYNSSIDELNNLKIANILKLRYEGKSLRAIASEVNMSLGYVFNILKDFGEPLHCKRGDSLILNYIDLPFNINEKEKIHEYILKRYYLNENSIDIYICKTIDEIINILRNTVNLQGFKILIVSLKITLYAYKDEKLTIEISYKKQKNKKSISKKYLTMQRAISYLENLEN